MPRKPNRRDTQPYVPAGNGDESGEYRGYTSGDTYRPGYKPRGGGQGQVVPKGKGQPPRQKPSKEEPTKESVIQTPPKEDDIKPQVPNKGENYKSVNDYVSSKEHSTYNKKQKEFIGNFTKDCDDTCNQLIAKAQKETGVFYRIGSGSCSFGYDWISGDRSDYTVRINKESLTDSAKDDDYGMGSVFYHENGHLIDGTLRRGYYSSNFRSSKYKMTLSDMIRQELEEKGMRKRMGEED